MIAIQVLSRAGMPLDVPIAASFGEAGGDIGRGVDCTLVLPDPDRRISRKQALIGCHAGRYFIRQVGANPAVQLDGQQLAPEVDYELAPGAQIRIGTYLLQVAQERVAAGLARQQPLGIPQAMDADEPADDPLALFGASPRPRASAFGDLLGGGAPASPNPSPMPLPAGRANVPAAMPEADPPQTMPFARRQNTPRPPPPATPPSPPPAPPLPEVDLLVGEPTGMDVPRARTPVPSPSPVARGPSQDELLTALFAGLGMRLPEPAARSPRQMELIGRLLRAATEGTLELLAARTVAKRELGANPTMLQTRENNPLKFSPDVDAALGHLLGPAQRGFTPPLESMQDAFDDLRAHQVALLAGMRAALEAVLLRFNPDTLEQRLTRKGMWDNLVPASRKSKLWEDYTRRYAEIMREAEADFDHQLFGRAFIQAYEAQLAQLSRRASGNQQD